MTLVNIDPHVILHQKMHVSSTGIFVGRSIGLPAPCDAFQPRISRKLVPIHPHRNKCARSCLNQFYKLQCLLTMNPKLSRLSAILQGRGTPKDESHAD